ncbi:hypothetical protein GCM10007416_19980 [Kroppenstedtia guangzhouensis]|jgi:hypothetical protein|uniref:4 TMS phage holin, superfamily IV n=1 Tax=Kroppenstedtia guangzhouensis TaxID=1274356 RepID=A0ABQ1GMV2_9BACL|nr:YndM family protein [Kroppenstedtia guangzhouensis]GGA46814.1 hypothetical protein GCM10007416_19980 [Kroppenstedtia guangzhouensis]
MLRYVTGLLIKFVMTVVISWLVLGAFFGISFPAILTASVVLTGVSFLIGDLLILPKFGNAVATIADLGLVWLGIWVLGSFLFEQAVSLGAASFMSAFFIAIGEILFHKYMKNQVLMDPAGAVD